MRKTHISVTYRLTSSLGNYSNVSPSITIDADIDHGDWPEMTAATLMNQARDMVHEYIDQALEAQGDPAKYSPAERYDLLIHRLSDTYIIVPARFPPSTFGEGVYCVTQGHRYHSVMRIAYDRACNTNDKIIDYSTPDNITYAGIIERIAVANGADEAFRRDARVDEDIIPFDDDAEDEDDLDDPEDLLFEVEDDDEDE